MIGLLTVAVLVLMGIAIWQINNIYQLIQNKLGNKKDNSQIANEKDNDLQGRLMFAFLVFIYIVTIYCFWAYSRVLLPEAASEHGVPYDRLLWISFAIILFDCVRASRSLALESVKKVLALGALSRSRKVLSAQSESP